jgi:hypothetical protein
MREVKHWHVVEEKTWEGDCYRHSYTWRPVRIDPKKAHELEQMWALKRQLEAKRVLLEADLNKQMQALADAAELLDTTLIY